MSKIIHLSSLQLASQVHTATDSGAVRTRAFKLALKGHWGSQVCSVALDGAESFVPDCVVTVKRGDAPVAVCRAGLERAWSRNGYAVVWY